MGIIDELFEGSGVLGLNLKNRFKKSRKEISSLMQQESDFQAEKSEKNRKKQVEDDIEVIMKEDYGIEKNPEICGFYYSEKNNQEKEKESPMQTTIRRKLKEIDQMVQP